MDLGQYWQEIVVIGTPFFGFMIIGVIKFIKNKLAGNVITSGLLKIKNDLGVEDYNALTNVVKNIGVKKAVSGVSEIINEVKDIKAIIPLIIAMSQTHLELGVYDELPVIKEIVEKTLQNVE
jgi:hypothetical protein